MGGQGDGETRGQGDEVTGIPITHYLLPITNSPPVNCQLVTGN